MEDVLSELLSERLSLSFSLKVRCDFPDESQLRAKICGRILKSYYSMEEKQYNKKENPSLPCQWQVLSKDFYLKLVQQAE